MNQIILNDCVKIVGSQSVVIRHQEVQKILSPEGEVLWDSLGKYLRPLEQKILEDKIFRVNEEILSLSDSKLCHMDWILGFSNLSQVKQKLSFSGKLYAENYLRISENWKRYSPWESEECRIATIQMIRNSEKCGKIREILAEPIQITEGEFFHFEKSDADKFRKNNKMSENCEENWIIFDPEELRSFILERKSRIYMNTILKDYLGLEIGRPKIMTSISRISITDYPRNSFWAIPVQGKFAEKAGLPFP